MVKIRFGRFLPFLPFQNRKPNRTHIAGTEPSEKLKIQIRNRPEPVRNRRFGSVPVPKFPPLEIADYVSRCLSCQQVKASRQRPSGLLHPLPIPVWKWDHITMDFVYDLPRTRNGHDGIWVIVIVSPNRLISYRFGRTTSWSVWPSCMLMRL